MERREFIKTGICIGCVGIIGAACCYSKFLKEPNIQLSKEFMYNDESELPKKIKLDICNLCQLNCAACWIRESEEEIKKTGGGFGYVSFKTYKDFLDKHPFIEEIELSNNGEVFLNPELEDIIRYSYEKGVQLTAWGGVNLNTLPDNVAEALVKYKFKHISVSIDGATPDVYKIYRRGGDFNTVINNVKKINMFKEKYNSEFPDLTYKFILFGHNEHEIDKAKALAEELNMNMDFAINFFPEYSPLKDKEKTYALAGIQDPDTDGFNSWIPCRDMFTQPQINYNGDLLGCCVLYLESFGKNVFKDGLLNALNCDKLVYAKMMLSDFSVKPRSDNPCSKCQNYLNLKEKNTPIENV